MKDNSYRFSLGKMFVSVIRAILSNEWVSLMVLLISSLLLFSLWSELSQRYLFKHPIAPIIDGLIVAVIFFAMGYYGYLAFKFKFLPSKGKFITGKSAVIFGLAIMIFCWSFAIYSLCLAFLKLIN